jgi:integrase
MGRRRSLTDKQVAALPRKKKRYVLADPELRNHVVRVPASGPATYYCVCRSPSGKLIWHKVGATNEIGIEEARTRCREATRKIKAGEPLVEPQAGSVAVVTAEWLKRHVEKNRHRAADEQRRIITKYVVPLLGERPFATLRRSDVAAFLDKVEDANGASMADHCLATLRSVGSWYSARHDDYVAPFAGRHMRRVPAQKRHRARILSDVELRAIWRAAEGDEFGSIVKMLLLSAQRFSKVTHLQWSDLTPDGVWVINTQDREKSNAGQLQLPRLALDVIAAQKRCAGSPFVFQRYRETGGGAKAIFDKKCGISGWVLHDLRRTARSLMSRAGVLSEHAERVLGHAIVGVVGVYDRHDYFDQKTHALQRLAALVEQIASGPAGGNVVQLPVAS